MTTRDTALPTAPPAISTAGRAVLQAALAAQRSAREGREVRVEEVG